MLYPENREKSSEIPKMQSFLPYAVLKIKKKNNIKIKIAAKKVKLSGEGGKICENLYFSEINAVARRLSDSLLKGPEINPSIKGIIAAETMYVVKRKSAFLYCFKNAQKSDSKPLTQKAAKTEKTTAKIVGKFVFPSQFNKIAQKKPPA